MSNFEIYHYSLLIREHHLDSFGHVNHATYLELLEEARWDFVTSKGFGLEVVHRTGIGPVVLSLEIQFLKEIRLRQTISIESQLISYDKKIGTLQQTILDDSNTVCTKAKLVFGLFDIQARKLMMPTEAWLEAMGVLDISA